MAVYVREYLTPGIEKVPTQGSETIVIKLKKTFLDSNLTYIFFFPIAYLLIAAMQSGLNLTHMLTLNKKMPILRPVQT